MTTRRRILQRAVLGAGAAALEARLPRFAAAQDSDAALIDRLTLDLQTHAGFGLKFAGGPGDEMTADWTATRLRGAGYEVDVPEFDTPFFSARRSDIRFGQESLAVVPQAPVLVTPYGGTTARLAMIDEEGQSDDLRGRIAVFTTPFARHAALFPDRGIGATVIAAVAAGAAAIVIVTNGPSGEAVALNCTDQGPFVPVPVAVIAPRLAGPLLAAAQAGAEATLTIDGDATRRPCKNVVAVLERGPRWLAMSTPRSGWYHCVAERGTGQAAFLELASWFVAAFPAHSVFLMNTGAHEYFFAGSHRVLDRAPPAERTDVWAHIGATLAARDAVEVDGRWQMLDKVDPQRSTMSTAAARDAVIASFAGLVGLDEPGLVRPQAGELSTFTDLGYEKAFACIGQHRWFHTVGDTLDCVDAGLLLPVVRAHQDTIRRLVTA